MTAERVVAIDGAAGSGKSTLARNLARAVRLPYVNTGLMYRALTASAIRNGVSEDDVEALIDLTRALRFTLGGSDPRVLKVEDFDDGALTTPAVERMPCATACSVVMPLSWSSRTRLRMKTW